MGLAELIARRDVSDALVQIEILEPWCFANVEMIDRVQIVIEAGQRDLACAQSAAIGQPSVDQQNFETGARQIVPRISPWCPAPMMMPYDGIIIGAGHHGLILGAISPAPASTSCWSTGGSPMAADCARAK